MQAKLHSLLFQGPRWLGAVIVIVIAAGAASGVVLSGAVGGLLTTTVSQALVVQDITVSGADVQLGSIGDDRTKFSVAAEINAGDRFSIHLSLGNEGSQDLTGELTMSLPVGVTASVDGQNDVACQVRKDLHTWIFGLASGVTNENTDLIITLAVADNAMLGYYKFEAELEQLDRSRSCSPAFVAISPPSGMVAWWPGDGPP